MITGKLNLLKMDRNVNLDSSRVRATGLVCVCVTGVLFGLANPDAIHARPSSGVKTRFSPMCGNIRARKLWVAQALQLCIGIASIGESG
jgi:hypothetical protein